MIAAALVAFAFLCGSIPFGVLIGRTFFASDLRASGSGNIGAANALRTYGKGAGAAVLVLDALKGWIPVALAAWLAGTNPWVPVGAGIAALLGHCYSPWLQWKGGKGVATHLGVCFGLAWPSGLVFVAAWMLAALPSRYSSAGSLAGTLASTVVLALFRGVPGLAYGLVALAVIVWRHRENVRRLCNGTENAMSIIGPRLGRDGRSTR